MDTKINKKRNLNYFIIFLFSLFLIGFVSSQPPGLEGGQQFPTGLFVEFVQINTHENNKDLIFNSHVFNITDGTRRLNDTTECNIHVFDNTGFHIVNQLPMPFDVVGLDWDITIDKGNFTRNGLYSFLVVCNSSDNFGGFVTSGFEITPSGAVSITDGEGSTLFGIIMILILTTIFFMIATMYIQNEPFKIFLGGLSVLMLVATMGFGVTIMQQLFSTNPTLISSYTLFFRLFTILLTGAGIGLMLFLITFAVKMFNKSRGIID